MSSYGLYSETAVPYTFEQPVLTERVSLKRSSLLCIPFLIPVLFCGISWLGGGIQFLTDAGFSTLVVLCVMGLVFETLAFSRRFGIGGMILFGGIIVWYCMDYMARWFNADFSSGYLPYSALVISKAAFSTTAFAFAAVVGLQFRPWRPLVRWAGNFPEPPSTTTYLVIILLTLFIGLIPYVFFTRGSFAVNMWKAMTAMRTGNGVAFTEGRTGNLNYSWGGYLAQLIQIGDVGGVLAAFYVVMTPGKGVQKWIAIAVWAFWTAVGFGTGGRGQFLFAALPVAVLLFIKYMMISGSYLKKFSGRAVIYSGIFLFGVLIVVQIQGAFRNVGLQRADVEKLDVFKVRGNDMFSEGLLGYATFPDVRSFARDEFFGATVILPMPDVVVRFAIGWIPRVIWHDKPGFSDTSLWYNQRLSGGTANNTTGGTITPSIAGGAYISYGIPGVIEMGLLFGYLCKLTEAFLWKNLTKPFGMVFALGCAAYLVRAFRDLTPHDLYPLLIGCTVIYVMIKLAAVFGGASSQPALQLETA